MKLEGEDATRRGVQKTVAEMKRLEDAGERWRRAAKRGETEQARMWATASKGIDKARQDLVKFNAEVVKMSRNEKDIAFGEQFGKSKAGMLANPFTGQGSLGNPSKLDKAAEKLGRVDTAIRSVDTLTNSFNTLGASIKGFDGSMGSVTRIFGDLASVAATTIFSFVNLKNIIGDGGVAGKFKGLIGFALNPLTIAITAVIGSVILWKKWMDEIRESEEKEKKLIDTSTQRGGWFDAIRRNSDSEINLLKILEALREEAKKSKTMKTADGRDIDTSEFVKEIAAVLDQRLDKFGWDVSETGGLSKKQSATEEAEMIREQERLIKEEMRMAKESQRELERQADREARLAKELRREEERAAKALERAAKEIEKAAISALSKSEEFLRSLLPKTFAQPLLAGAPQQTSALGAWVNQKMGTQDMTIFQKNAQTDLEGLGEAFAKGVKKKSRPMTMYDAQRQADSWIGAHH